MAETALTLTEESELIKRSRVDSYAFAALYDHYFPKVYKYVFFRVRDQPAADDLVASIFLKALDRLDSFREKRGGFGTWLFSIARNALIDHYRASNRSVPLPLANVPVTVTVPSAEQSVIQRQSAEELLAHVSQLSEREQEIISLRFGGELSNKRIGALLGLTENHVAVILYRAMGKLRHGLGGERES